MSIEDTMSIEAASETDQILRVQADWITHEQNGHQDAVLHYCSDDVVWLVPELAAFMWSRLQILRRLFWRTMAQ